MKAIADLTRCARKMLGILEAEIANHRSMTVSGAHEALAKLRTRLAVLEKDVATAIETTHDAGVLVSVESAGLASRVDGGRVRTDGGLRPEHAGG